MPINYRQKPSSTQPHSTKNGKQQDIWRYSLNHPGFPSGHATINSSVMKMLTNVFGDNFQITLHTYDYLNLPARSYNSFEEMSIEMANSRVYGGIHYQATCDKSRVQGKKVAQNILNTIKFSKGN